METFPPLPDWVKVEHQVATLLTEQEIHGWYFDVRAAQQLTASLQKELEETQENLRRRHPFVKGEEKTPKRNNKRQGYIEGATFTRLKEFNTTSRDHIAWILTTFYGWKPTQLTPTGKYYRRNDSERDWIRSFYDVTEMFDGNENAWSPLRRHERLAEACYE